MSESVVDAGYVEETVTQVLTHFVQGGNEQVAMSVQLLQEQVEIQLGFFDFFGAAGPIFCFLPVLTFCLAYYQP